MSERSPTRAAGAPLALLTVAGAVAGTIMGQPTIGTLAGFGAGAALALLLWWRDRAS